MTARENISSYRWAVLGINGILLAAVYMSLSSWAVAVPELKEYFNLSSTYIMLGSAFLIAGYSIGSYVEGHLLAKYGWRKVLGIVMLAFLLASVAIPYAPNYPVVLLLRFIQGWGLVVVITSNVVSSWFPVRQRGIANGILLGMVPGGVAIGGVVSGNLLPAFGWQNTFLILAAIVAVCVILNYLISKDAPLEISEQKPVEQETEVVVNDISPKKPNIYRTAAVWLMGLAMFCNFFQVYGMYSFLGDYLYTLGFAPVAVGTLILINGLIGVVSTPVGGIVSDRIVSSSGNALKARAYSMVFVGFLVAAIGSWLVPFLAPLGFGLASLAMIIMGWGIPATNGPLASLPVDLFGPKVGGEAFGLVLLIAGAGGIIAPIFVTWMASTFGWYVGWFITGAAAAIGVIAGLILPAAKPDL
jgi:MFS family permease